MVRPAGPGVGGHAVGGSERLGRAADRNDLILPWGPLGSAALVRWLWNYLVADFPRLPRLTYRRTLAAVVLWGVLLAVVLTMIAGARELRLFRF